MVTPRRPVPCQVDPARHEEWWRLLAGQHGVVSTGQLREFSVTQSAVTANVRGGRWQHLVAGVYATFTGPLTTRARIAAALCSAGPGAILSHRTAAELWGMLPAEPGPVHVTVRYGCSAVSRPSLLVCHRSRALQYIAVDAEPPLSSRADTVIDLAVAEPTARRAMQVLTALVTGRKAAACRIRQQLELRPPPRYRDVLKRALDRIDNGVQSPLEELYAVDVESAHGIPGARRQEPFTVDGRTLVEDAVYDQIGVPLTVRLDGSTHLLPEVAERDRRRDNAAELANRARLVFGWSEVSRQPCLVAGEVFDVLRRYGWQGPTQACPRCS
jgi:hypothetical protein